MAAFTASAPADRDAFDRHWARILTDDAIVIRTVLAGEEVAGHVLVYEEEGRMEVSYWLGHDFWGRGIATRALSLLLEAIEPRPLYARAAKDHTGSLRVLEKCGFAILGEERGFANARGQEIEEVVLVLVLKAER